MKVALVIGHLTFASLVVKKVKPAQTYALIGRVSMRCLLERGGIKVNCR